MSRLASFTTVAALLVTAAPFSLAEDYEPPISPRSNEGRTAIQTFAVPEGMKVELVASEPDLANPVCFCIDERGRFFVGETFRQKKGVEDNRSHMNWLHDDLAAQTVADRVAFFRKHLGDKVSDYTKEQDRIRLLEDTNGDGTVDKATVFADGFNRIEDGTGAGLLARKGNVFYTCIPDLWLLQDENGDGKADVRKSLHTGYGVRVAFRGHDMHGLVMGPDGRLYFSIGDRGYNVETMEGERLVRPDTGAVFRCEPDGSKLEVFAYGLRNPQELAFDDYGNLFTGDNNSDSGDQARWVHVVQGSDSGWRMYYQYLEDRGPWNREMMWYPVDAELKKNGPGGVPAGSKARDLQPAFIVPPVANLGDGPSGLVAYPGVGLSKRYDGHFFLCDFRGNPSNSGIRSFAVKPKGASFELVDSHQFVWHTLVTDVDFGYDGSMYATDWVAGWDGPGKGRLYRYTDQANASQAADVAELFHDGFEKRETEELVELLAHADRRVRQEAQFALVDRADVSTLGTIAADGSQPSKVRIHAIFGLGQLTRRGNKVAASRLNKLVVNQPPEILEVAARTFGDSVEVGSEVCTHCIEIGTRARLIALLTDHPPYVQAAAAQALGAIGEAGTVASLLAVLDGDTSGDPVLRHAVVMGLVEIAARHDNALDDHMIHPGVRGRMAVLLAQRRAESTGISAFLRDADRALQLEAARAINDLPIDAALPTLADLAGRPMTSEALVRRVMNANFRLGTAENATAVAAFAANESLPEPLRLEAIAELATWGAPSPIDRVTGRWAPLEKRDAQVADRAVRSALGSVLAGGPKLREEGVKLAATYGIKEVGPTLLGLVRDREQPPSIRAESLAALDAVGFEGLRGAAETALKTDPAPEVRIAARRILVRLFPNNAANILDSAIDKFGVSEKQDAIAQLAKLDAPGVGPVLAHLYERLADGKLPAEIQLDVIELATARDDAPARKALAEFDAARPTDPLGPYVECVEGGSVRRGEQIFFGRSAASCRRCHAVQGNGGIVGPNLSAIGNEKDQRYLLEAIVNPNAKIAKGFETVVVATIEGKVHAGILKAEDEQSLTLMTPEAELIVVAKDDIDDRAVGKSGMPEDLVKQLTKADVRDLVAYLASLRTEDKSSGHAE